MIMTSLLTYLYYMSIGIFSSRFLYLFNFNLFFLRYLYVTTAHTHTHREKERSRVSVVELWSGVKSSLFSTFLFYLIAQRGLRRNENDFFSLSLFFSLSRFSFALYSHQHHLPPLYYCHNHSSDLNGKIHTHMNGESFSSLVMVLVRIDA